jgi:hypothetical protein
LHLHGNVENILVFAIESFDLCSHDQYDQKTWVAQLAAEISEMKSVTQQ